jgi:hydrogenase maturation protease
MPTSDEKTVKTLILGIGNLVMSDDGVGVIVVQRLQREYRLPPEVTVMDGGTLGLDILPHLEGIERLIVVDALNTGKAPGSCVRLAGNEIPLALETKLSPHQMGLKDLLTVSLLMGHAPKEMVLIGVQPGCIEMGTELSPAVEVRIETMLESILSELKQWGIKAEDTKSS